MKTPRLSELPPEHGIWLEIDLTRQILQVWDGREAREEMPISSGASGVGQQRDSGKTPLGWHYIRAAIGDGQPCGAVFRGRRPSGEIYSLALAEAYPERDWILTRILWLCGLEKGFNRGGGVDSQRRYIYLHGTPQAERMGSAVSRGCIHLRDDALLHLFDLAPAGTPVWLHI